MAASFTGVDQTSVAVACPHGNTALVTSSTTCSVTITSATGNMTAAGAYETSGNMTATSATTLALDNTGPNAGVAGSYASGAASVVMTATISVAGRNNSFGCDILAASGVGLVRPLLYPRDDDTFVNPLSFRSSKPILASPLPITPSVVAGGSTLPMLGVG